MTAVFGRRAQALVIFVDHALQGSLSEKRFPDVPVGEAISDLVSLLVQLATLPRGSASDSNVDHIAKAAQSTMSRSFGVMPASGFVGAVLTMLKSGEDRVSLNCKFHLSSETESDCIRFKPAHLTCSAVAWGALLIPFGATSHPLSMRSFITSTE
jgi:hypothetical protein